MTTTDMPVVGIVPGCAVHAPSSSIFCDDCLRVIRARRDITGSIAPNPRADRYADVLRANDIPGDVAPDDSETPRRWCLTYTARMPGDYDADPEWAVETFDALDHLQEQAADLVLNGYALEGIFDLDTGRAFGPHVSTPVVTCSEDSGSAPAVIGFAACDADDIDDDARRS